MKFDDFCTLMMIWAIFVRMILMIARMSMILCDWCWRAWRITSAFQVFDRFSVEFLVLECKRIDCVLRQEWGERSRLGGGGRWFCKIVDWERGFWSRLLGFLQVIVQSLKKGFVKNTSEGDFPCLKCNLLYKNVFKNTRQQKANRKWVH